MNIKQKLVLVLGAAALILVVVFPPVRSTVSYQGTSGVTNVRPEIHYEFLFNESSKDIHFSRLFLQCLIVLIVTVAIIFMCKRPKGYHRQLEQKIAELMASRKLQRAESQHEQVEKELTTANKKLERQLKQRGRAEEALTKLATQLTAANEKLQQQIAERTQAEQHLDQQTAELGKANEKLQREITQLHRSEQKGQQCRDQLEQAIEHKTADLEVANQRLEQAVKDFKQAEQQLTIANEKLECEINQRRLAAEEVLEGITQVEQGTVKIPSLDREKLEALAELAKRLS